MHKLYLLKLLVKMLYLLCLLLFSEHGWFLYDKTIAAIGAVGSLATLAAFLFLFKKDENKQAQLDQLSTIAQALSLQVKNAERKLRLSVKPDLWLNGSQIKGGENRLDIDLNNKGETAYLTSVTVEGKDIELDSDNPNAPYELEKEERRWLFFRCPRGVDIAQIEYVITIYFEDKLKNEYRLIIEGKGGRPRIKKVEEL